MSINDNWVIRNLENALGTWNQKLSELWQLVTQTPETFKGGQIITVLQIVEPELFERAQSIMQGRTQQRSNTPINMKSNALLTGKIYCGHCRNRLTLTTSGRKRTKKDGTVKKETRMLSGFQTVAKPLWKFRSSLFKGLQFPKTASLVDLRRGRNPLNASQNAGKGEFSA